MIPVDWNEAIRIDRTDAGRYRANVDEHWTSLQGVHGGIVAALALRAAEDVVHAEPVEPHTTLRAATFGYVSGNRIGDLDIEAEVVRRGRKLVTTHARTAQDGRTTTVARFHHSPPWDAMAYSDVPPPPPRPDGTIRLAWGETPAHLNNVETYLHPDTTVFAGTERAEWIAWARPLVGGTFDSAWLVMFADYLPPAVFTKATEPQRAVSIEYSIQIHDAAGAWTLDDGELLAVRMHAFHSHDGFAVEDGWIHLPDGTLLATTRQTRLAG